MLFGSEFVNGQIIDSNQLNSTLDKELGTVRFQVNELRIELPIPPML
jgi:hypothetical protein